MQMLARYGRPLALLDGSLLLGGLLLTAFNMLLVGWSVYAAGYVLALVTFPAIGAMYRDRFDGWAWTAVLMVEVGLLLGLPQVVSIWSTYYQTPTGIEMLVPSQAAPIGLFAELIFWIAIAFFGLAARGVRALPKGVGWIFVVAALFGLAAAFFDVWFITPLWWVPAMLVLALGLVSIGGSLPQAAQRALSEASA